MTDSVVAVIVTIRVLELKPPHGADLASLAERLPTFLSFLYVAIYRTNPHHFFEPVAHARPIVVWANFNPLFWLSLIPFATAWMDEHDRASVPVAVYGAVPMTRAVGRYASRWRSVGSAIRLGPPHRLGRDLKGRLSPLGYLIGIVSAFVAPTLSYAVYALLAVAWLLPDRRVIGRSTNPSDAGPATRSSSRRRSSHDSTRTRSLHADVRHG